jgi:hypothetical protein
MRRDTGYSFRTWRLFMKDYLQIGFDAKMTGSVFSVIPLNLF